MSREIRGSVCVIKVDGELTRITGREFTGEVTGVLAAFTGPVLFDLSGVDFMDCHGARTIAAAVRAARGESGLRNCSPVVSRVLSATGFDPSLLSAPVRVVSSRPRLADQAGSPSHGEILTASIRATKSNVEQSAAYTGEVMSRLAATYAQLALSSRYRVLGKSEDRGRLLTLSGRALHLSRQYLRYAARDAGLRQPHRADSSRSPWQPDEVQDPSRGTS